MWFGTNDVAPGRSTVFSADTTLRQWGWPDPQRDGAPATGVAALLAFDGALWVAARDGLFRLDQDAATWQRFDTREGLPSATITALATGAGALWIGTRQGACLWRDGAPDPGSGRLRSGAESPLRRAGACGPTLVPGFEVTALAYCGRSLWIGTSRGLLEATSGGIVRAEPPGFTGGVRALACQHGALYLAGARALVVREGETWGPPLAVGGSGTINSLSSDSTGVWVAGAGGAARWDPAAGEWLTYLVPGDIPVGPVLSAQTSGGRLWLATPAGALRIEPRGR
jgi:ligand-binding sensor domain-containing protein